MLDSKYSPMTGSSKKIAGCFLRVVFGLSLLLIGIGHYMSLASLSTMISDGLGPLAGIGSIWAYIMPALEIIAGITLTINMYRPAGAWAAGLAFGSMAIGTLAKTLLSGADLGAGMGMAQVSLLWLLFLYFALKSSGCGSGCNCGPDCNCGASHTH